LNRKRKTALALLGGFILLTAALCFVDVQPIGPENSSVGFATIHGFVHRATGVNFSLYILTDWLGLVPIGFCIGFGILGLYQWMKRKSFLKMDRDLILLGIFYLVVGAVYLLFEALCINYRPTLIANVLEASYPSSTTILASCVMATTALQLKHRIKDAAVKNWILFPIYIFTAFMVVGRLISGVHWLTDILGGILCSAGLVLLYDWCCDRYSK